MAVQQLSTLITDGGLYSPNFFNGRLLTAEDLTAEHQANQQARDWLGQTVGDGVAYGLEVQFARGNTPARPVVNVTPGLAINRAGHTLVLTSPIDMSLVATQSSTGTTNAPSGSFGACQPPQAGVYVSAAGVYLLVVAPASGTAGRAQISGLGNVDATCNTKSLIDGVQFRLIQLPLSATELDDVAHLRNHVAYRCFGSSDPKASNFVLDPFVTPASQYGLLDDLRDAALTDCDVPLATLYWTAQGGIDYIDWWSVKRRITRSRVTHNWPLLIGDRRVSEHEAIFLQFQAQIASLRMAQNNPTLVHAVDHFQFLPPVGFLPLAAPGSLAGFEANAFFDKLTTHIPVYLEGAVVEPLVRTALSYPPMDLSSAPAIFLYLVRENRDPRLGSGSPYLIFTSVEVPFVGVSRYDISHWDYGTYANPGEL